jgi:hypothetical protein
MAPTIAQSWARRWNFWYEKPTPGSLGTRISVSISSGARQVSRNPVHKPRAPIVRSPPPGPPTSTSTVGVASRSFINGQERHTTGQELGVVPVLGQRGGGLVGRADPHVVEWRRDHPLVPAAANTAWTMLW